MGKLAVGCLVVVALAASAYISSRAVSFRHRGGATFHAPTRVSIRSVSGRVLACLFDGLRPNKYLARGQYHPTTKIQPCSATHSGLSRVLERAGLEVTVYAQSSCESNRGICIGCAGLDGRDNVTLGYGSCVPPQCPSGLAGYTLVFSSPGSGNGYSFTGTNSCDNTAGCACSLQYRQCSGCNNGE
jgi:hypothetical protein